MHKSLKLLLFLFTIAIATHAQKLPNKQEISLYAPSNIKIDGKPTEWDNKFQAYNNSTDIFYTIANNTDNIYLIIQATDPDLISKIYLGGLTFTVNPSGKKNDKNGITVTFPVWDKNNEFHINLGVKPRKEPNSAVLLRRADSFMNAANTKMTDRSKMIMVTGIKGMDPLISVYNENGIKAMALFNNDMAYTLEMSIALKYLGIDVNNTPKIVYHVLLHPKLVNDNVTRTQEIGPDGMMRTVVHLNTPRHFGDPADDARANGLRSITDFWGEYTLAKKP